MIFLVAIALLLLFLLYFPRKPGDVEEDDSQCNLEDIETASSNKYKLSVILPKIFWTLTILFLYMLMGTIIFQGIEGNHFLVHQHELVEEQVRFNITRIDHLPLGGSRSSGPNITERNMTARNEKYARMKRIFELKCEVAKIDLKGWNNKSFGDSVVYAASIITTLGYGVYYPLSTGSRIICMFYAIIGIPLFSLQIGICIRILKDLEIKIRSSKRIRRIFGNSNVFLTLIFKVFVSEILYTAWIIQLLYNRLEPANGEVTGQLLRETNSEIEWSFTSSLYFVVTTLGVIGFGELYLFEHGSEFYNNLFNVIAVLLTTIFIATAERIFEGISNYFDNSLHKKVIRLHTMQWQQKNSTSG